MSSFNPGNAACSSGWSQAAYNAWVADTANNGFVGTLTAAMQTLLKSQVFNLANGFVQSKGWSVQVPISVVAPVGATVAYSTGNFSFTTAGGTILVLGFGSGFRTVAGLAVMSLVIDGTTQTQSRFFYNAASSHGCINPCVALVAGLASGSHTISMNVDANTSLDQNDQMTAVVLEFPW